MGNATVGKVYLEQVGSAGQETGHQALRVPAAVHATRSVVRRRHVDLELGDSGTAVVVRRTPGQMQRHGLQRTYDNGA